MAAIDLARRDDGPAVVSITEKVGIFTVEELSCVQSIWFEFQDRGESSGYAFLVYRDDYG